MFLIHIDRRKHEYHQEWNINDKVRGGRLLNIKYSRIRKGLEIVKFRR